MEVRVKTKDLPAIKAKLIAKQNGICPLCKGSLTRLKPVNVVVDHCHKTGHIRAALCRGCNGAEGKIKNLAVRFGKTADFIVFVKRLVEYWLHHKEPKTSWIHPTHKTDDEKRLARNKKARDKRASNKEELARREASLKRRLKDG